LLRPYMADMAILPHYSSVLPDVGTFSVTYTFSAFVFCQ